MSAQSPQVANVTASSTPLTKKFGFWSIVLLTVNSIIGLGIFLSPAGVVKVAGGWTPLVYIIAGVFAAILALTFASAAKYVSTNGASYAYTHTAFGDDLGFYVGITRFVAASIAWGVMATAVVRSTLGILGGKDAATMTNITIGFIILMAILLGISLAGTHIVKWFNNASTIGKITALVVVIVAGLAIVLIAGQNNYADIYGAVNGKAIVPAMDTTIFVTAVLAAFYAYTGFETTATAASEMQKPERDIPRAIPLALGIVTVIYVGVISIAMMVNPLAILKSTDPVILASAFDNPFLRGIIITGAIISMFGINVAAAFSTPRILDAMSRRGQVPAALCRESKRGVPIFAFILTGALAIVIPMTFSYEMRGIMVISSVTRFIQFIVVPLAVIAFFYNRAQQRINEAPRNLLTDVIVPLIGLAASVFLLIKFDWVGQFSTKTGPNWYAIVAMIIGYIVLPLALYIPWKLGLYKKDER